MREELRSARSLGLVISAATYLVALVVAMLVVRAAGLAHPLADLGLGTLVATVVVFAVSMAVDNSSIYDPYWSLQPLAIAGYYLWNGWSDADARQIVVICLVFLYALRLTSNFYREWPGLGKEDFRYISFRERFGRGYWPVSFLGIHLFPTVMVYLGCLPLYALTRSGAVGLGWLDGLGIVVTLGAVILAFVADEQLRAFRGKPGNRGRVIGSGPWARSRHPNYLGEVATWWGLWIFALAAGLEWWWTVVGAAAITAMFVFVSIPMMERRVLATRPDYAEYRDQTPMLVPRSWPIRGDPPSA
jgi:steroid 5-alpha reductase family enzyme